MKGRFAIGFATDGGTTKPPPLFFLSKRSSEFMLGGSTRVIVEDGGVANGAVGRSTVRGVLQALTLLFEDIAKSKEGTSCGGEERGAGPNLFSFAFFCRRRESGSVIVRRVLGPSGVAGADMIFNCICGMNGGGGKGFCSGFVWPFL